VTDRLRAVFDTNVFVSAFLSRNPTSPTQELIRRWQADEFTLLISAAIATELAEKLLEHNVASDEIVEFLALLEQLAEWVEVLPEQVEPVISSDPDDDAVLACAVVGRADYLISYDPHVESLGEYRGIKVAKALPFLWAVRGDQPPG
jgi:putative PIN family toxin of toxin-antitoxin system